jgi:ATP-dependent helicase/nuclease subunit B
MRRESVFTIASHAPFLETLVARLRDGTLLPGHDLQGPFGLADITIVLPTRRARLALADAFARSFGGSVLLPDIRTFGGEAPDEEPFLPPFDAPPLPRAVPPFFRTLTLARLVDAWARSEQGRALLSNPPSAAEIFGLADSLGQVIDDLAIEGGSLAALEAGMALELAENWLEMRQLLDIALEVWPKVLAAEGRDDAAKLRNERLRREADAIHDIYGDRPVIAAGSTGSIPATANLLRAITRLPQGVVVLPGVDTSLSDGEFATLRKAEANPQGHPHYVLMKLLAALGILPGAVRELSTPPGERTDQLDRPGSEARTALVRAALALPDATADWPERRTRIDIAAALHGTGPRPTADVALLKARTEDEEARAIALAARDALERKLTVGIISPDQTLSRRIAAELRRFEIVLDDAAGTPLAQSPIGRLVRLAIGIAETTGPVQIMSLLQNRAVTLGLPRAEVSRLMARLDGGVLRGRRLGDGLAGLATAIQQALKASDDTGPLLDLMERLGHALAPLSALLSRDTITVPDFAGAVMATLEALMAGGLPDALPPGFDALALWAREIADAEEGGPPFRPDALEAVFHALTAGRTVQPVRPGRDDIAIWGRLEARLMRRDMMILAGLNEEIWPDAADPGPWLSRSMRIAAGLEPPEFQQGQAAHDFEMALGNPHVVLAYAERRGTAPALPSRLVQRLVAFIGKGESDALIAKGAVWTAAARALDASSAPPVPALRPTPRPPVHLRPKQLSVTRIETLIRSPYDVYARSVLGLVPLEPLGQPLDAREVGTLAHDIFARFITEGGDPMDPDARARLIAITETASEGLEAIGDRRDIWLNRFKDVIDAFLRFERDRNGQIAERHAEIAGEWRLPSGFTLTGKADRVDIRTDGRVALIDFKTGRVPEGKDMKALLKPQLLLEAAMAEAGAFAGLGSLAPASLAYIKIALGPNPWTEKPVGGEDQALVDAVSRVKTLLNRHVEALLLSDDLPMAPHVLPDEKQNFEGAYDHLMRRDEWALSGEDEQ